MPVVDLPLHETIHLPPETRATAVTLTSTGRTAFLAAEVLGLLRKETSSHAVYFVYTGATFSNAVAE